jgi:hypothetical protein
MNPLFQTPTKSDRMKWAANLGTLAGQNAGKPGPMPTFLSTIHDLIRRRNRQEDVQHTLKVHNFSMGD